jgi:hypothetical protein
LKSGGQCRFRRKRDRKPREEAIEEFDFYVWMALISEIGASGFEPATSLGAGGREPRKSATTDPFADESGTMGQATQSGERERRRGEKQCLGC